MSAGIVRRGLEWLGGSALVYGALAACSGAGAPGETAAPSEAVAGVAADGGQSSGGSGQATQAAGSAGLASPVPDAMAAGGGVACECAPVAPREPVVVEAACVVSASSGAVLFAQAEFAGLSIDQLQLVVPRLNFAANIDTLGVSVAPPGFAAVVPELFVRDGAVAARCGTAGSKYVASSVTFTLL